MALAWGGVALGQGRTVAAPAPARSNTEEPTPIPGLTDKLGLDARSSSSSSLGGAGVADGLLGEPFESQTAGITFRPPVGGKRIEKTDPDNVVEYVNDDKRWLLKVTRARLSKPMPLQTVKKGAAGDQIGLLEYTVQDVLKTSPTAEVLRQEVVNVGEHGVGIAILRLSVGGERYLRQQAIFQGDEQLYYVFNFTSPATKQGQPNAAEQEAAGAFKAMLDTIQMLDRSWIKTDQTNRLYRTRALFIDWGDKNGRRVRDAIVPEQWLRIVQNGKDIGYSYVAEEFVDGKDVKANPTRPFDGVLISMRTRTALENAQVDVGSQMFTSMDRKHEDWQHIVNTIMNKGNKGGAEEKKQTMEFGYSEIKVHNKLDPAAQPDPRSDPNARDRKNPVLRPVESYELRIERATQGRNSNSQPEAHAPSPWYIPQAIGSMLPRLVPLDRPVTYLFQSYVGDQHEVILRYVDVGFQKRVTIDGQAVAAIPISDRIRLEGTPTVHYMSPQGKYLGSENAASKVWILPTDKATLERIWGNPDLTKPNEVEKPAGVSGVTGTRGAPVPIPAGRQ